MYLTRLQERFLVSAAGLAIVDWPSVHGRAPLVAEHRFAPAGDSEERHLVEARGDELGPEREPGLADAAGQGDRRQAEQRPGGLERWVTRRLSRRGDVCGCWHQQPVDLLEHRVDLLP